MLCEESLSGPFGDAILWKNYADGINEIKETHKPGMLVFHRSYCNACRRLGNDVRGNTELISRSRQFVMISCNGNEPESDAFMIGIGCSLFLELDGNYFPRIFFVNPNNTINYYFVSNPYNFQYRYYYRDSDQMNQRMKDFLSAIKLENEETEL